MSAVCQVHQSREVSGRKSLVTKALSRTWRQSKGLFWIYIQDGLAYKASGIIWVFTDVATAVTMPLVWLAASRTGAISGYSGADLVLYYLCLLMLSSFIVCHFMWDISVEIREGVFSTHIIRPVGYLWFIMVRNFAWRCVRCMIFLPWFLVILWFYAPSLGTVHLNLGWTFWASVILGHFVSVAFVTALAMLALITQEAQAIFELYYLPMLFLSGNLFPLALLPQWARNVGHALPFYYTTGAPTEILIGRVTGPDVYPVLLGQLAWFFGSLLMFKLLWKLGMKHYTGVGM